MTEEVQAARPPLTAMVVGIVGAGTMGVGIAQIAAQAGHRVVLYDSRPGATAAAVDTIAGTLRKLEAKGRLLAAEVDGAVGNFSVAGDLAALAPCGLVIEAIAEELGAKRELFQSLEGVVTPDALLATNTSSFSITAIGASLRKPQRLAGMHFFNPAPLMQLVEIVAGLDTAEATLDALEAVGRAWGKEPVRARSSPGFLVNRVARPFYGEALRLLQEGAGQPATLDAVFRESGGFRMGPFELMDLIGHDINLAVTRSVFEATFSDPRYTPSVLQKELVDGNRLGRKTGRGFFAYAPDVPRAEPDSVPAMPAPGEVRLFGADPLTALLRERLGAAQCAVVLNPPHADDRLVETPTATLYRTDGRSATKRAYDLRHDHVVLVDLAADYGTASRLALAAADQAAPGAVGEIAGLLQVAGFHVSVLDDAPGMAVMRTVAMLANEAADAVQQGICSTTDCDKAMRLGTSYPKGPLRWADTLGVAAVVAVLDHLHQAYGDARYRVSPLLRRKALTGSTFHQDGNDARD